MRGSLTRARVLGAALCLSGIVSALGGCTRTWELSNQSGGGSGATADAGAGGSNGGGGRAIGGAGGLNGGTGGVGGSDVAGGGGAGGIAWTGMGGRGRGGGPGGQGALGGQAGFGFPIGSGGRFGSGCTSVSWSISPVDVIFLVAHNQSMAAPLADGTSRTTGVIKAIQSVLAANPYAVNFGYQEFPSRTGCAGPTSMCCVSDDRSLRAGNLTDASDDYTLSCELGQSSTSCLSMTEGRPIAPTLMKTAPLFTSSDGNMHDNRYVVLMTDGPPGCGEDATEACNTAVAAISSLAKLAVVPVVALGDEASNNSCLKSMAIQGGYFGVPPPVTAKDTKSLTASLTQIVAIAALEYCTIKLNDVSRIDPGQEVVIRAFGHWISHDPNNGWEFWPRDQSQWIQVYGDACRMILQATPREKIEVQLCPKGNAP